MKTQTEASLIKAIETLVLSKEYVTVAIDGRCAAGKTTLALKLGERFSCNVFHIDDFYLSASQRHLKSQERGFANADVKRFENEVLKNILKCAPFTYFKYSCVTGKMEPVVINNPTKLNIVEGSYCTDLSIEKHYDLKVFMTADFEVRKTRLMSREKKIDEYVNKWMVFEENFFEAENTAKRADIIIET